MLSWLKENAYLAAWLALPVAIVIGFVQNQKLGFEKFDWSRNLLYLAFLVALAVKFSPSFAQNMHDDAGYVLFTLIGFLMLDRKPR
jgi:hypothetical protein